MNTEQKKAVLEMLGWEFMPHLQKFRAFPPPIPGDRRLLLIQRPSQEECISDAWHRHLREQEVNHDTQL